MAISASTVAAAKHRATAWAYFRPASSASGQIVTRRLANATQDAFPAAFEPPGLVTTT